MTALEQLLTVQELDTRADQLRHRRAVLPERARSAEAEAARDQLVSALAEADQRRAELQKEQRRLEDDVALVQDKTGEVDRTLYGSTGRGARELQALQDEVNALKRRQRYLEDQILELMEQLEPVEARRAQLEQRLAEQAEVADGLATELTAAEAEIEAEFDQVLRDRAGAVEGVSEELVREYEGLRSRLGGIGVARLNRATCDGCNLSLSAAEVSRIRKQPPDALVYCDECGRLLVR